MEADKKTWYILTLEVPAGDAETLAETLRYSYELEPILLEHPGGRQAWLELYHDTEELAHACRSRLAEEGVDYPSSVRVCLPQNWQSFWKHHFKVRPVGGRFVLGPEWEAEACRKAAAEAGRHALVLNPGLSFGTGDHFTTRFCLEALEQSEARESFLDAGTGSGVLAIGARLLGFENILAVDNDPQCLEQNHINAELNRVDGIDFRTADLLQGLACGPFDTICANIISSVLIECSEELVRATGSRLILSGIREREADLVADAFVEQGLRELVRDGDGEWCGLVLETVKGP